MTVTIQHDAPPIKVWEDGSIRIGSTRIPIERVIQEYQDGTSPAAIVEAYPTVKLADVFGVLAYYFRHMAEIDAYIAERERQADELQQQIEAKYGSQEGARERLLKKLAEKRQREAQ